MNSQRFYDFDTITDYYKKLLPTERELLDLCRRPMDADQCAEYLKENIVAVAEKEMTTKEIADITAYYMVAARWRIALRQFCVGTSRNIPRPIQSRCTCAPC